MATKKIQDLENIEEVLPDSIIPVGEATKTKSMLVSQLKKWLSNFFVNKTGDEKIEGNKRFLNRVDVNSVVGIFKGNYTKGTTPSSTQYWNVAFCDENGTDTKNRVGGIETRVVNDGSERTDLICFKNELNATESDRISIGYDSQGNVVTYAPASSIINSIVTTTAISKAPNGDLKLGNGVIIQWGKFTASSSEYQNFTITFPTPFSDTNYSFCFQHARNGSASLYASQVNERTKTNIKGSFGVGNLSGGAMWIAIGY